MKKILILLICFISILALALAIYNCIKGQNEAIVYIDLNRVHAEFKLAKELDQKFKDTQQQRKTVLDTLAFDIQMLERKLNTAPTNQTLRSRMEDMLADYERKQQAFGSDEQLQSNDYDKQIWNQINQYVQDYRVKNSRYKLIMGISGNGSVMAADKSLDISDDVILFINSKYDGKATVVK